MRLLTLHKSKRWAESNCRSLHNRVLLIVSERADNDPIFSLRHVKYSKYAERPSCVEMKQLISRMALRGKL